MSSAVATRVALQAGAATVSGRGLARAGRPRRPQRAPAPAPARPSRASGLAPGIWERDEATAGLSVARVERLGAYFPGGGGSRREVLQVTTADQGVLVLDCLGGTLTDALLIAHLGADEPSGNARIVCDLYLADPTRGRCCPLSAADLDRAGPVNPPAAAGSLDAAAHGLRDARGRTYLLGEVQATPCLLELRWTLLDDRNPGGPFAPVTLRDVIGALESYEPAVSITCRTLATAGRGVGVSTQRLAQEAQRLQRSPIVLNRGLRECVQRHLSCGVSMSEIATRCGRTKRDRGGNRSGETTWLARRIGQMPEGGESAPTPWVHTDTLARIARDGLGVSPREVEL